MLLISSYILWGSNPNPLHYLTIWGAGMQLFVCTSAFSPSTMLPGLRNTLSSHHWQCNSCRSFLADSSAWVGPLRTRTTTRTKCSRATANSTSIPLLQRAAALKVCALTRRFANCLIKFIYVYADSFEKDLPTWPLMPIPYVLRVPCNTRFGLSGNRNVEVSHSGI